MDLHIYFILSYSYYYYYMTSGSLFPGLASLAQRPSTLSSVSTIYLYCVYIFYMQNILYIFYIHRKFHYYFRIYTVYMLWGVGRLLYSQTLVLFACLSVSFYFIMFYFPFSILAVIVVVATMLFVAVAIIAAIGDPRNRSTTTTTACPLPLPAFLGTSLVHSVQNVLKHRPIEAYTTMNTHTTHHAIYFVSRIYTIFVHICIAGVDVLL